MLVPLPVRCAIWFVRADGGTRHSSHLSHGQCDGKSDMGYPGHGVNQHCAFNDVRYMYTDGTYGNLAWVMSGGDTLVIRGCNALPQQQNADAPHCRIGRDTADHSDFWCAGVEAGCTIPPPPSGTAEQHTKILGGCAYGIYSCIPVSSYPYTNNNLTQLFAGFGSNAMYLGGSSYVDIEGLEITAHNGQCARYGTTNPLPGCHRGDPSYSDQADQGITTTNTTSNILLQDVYIHGFSSNGIQGPIGGPFTLKRVSIIFNTFAGWNFDDGGSTPNAAGSTVTQSYVTMIGNGCQEEYPITHTQFPAAGCWDSQTGGFGDAWSGQNASMDSFTCDHCNISYNTKDAALGPHTGLKNLSLTNSMFAANMGQQGKWGMRANSTAYIVNNIIVGGCNRMSEIMPGAKQNFNANGSTLAGSGLGGFCRAAGDVFAFFAGANSSVRIANNTVVATSATVFDLSCNGSGTCGSSPYYFTNNIFLGYVDPSYPGSNNQAPGLYYNSDPAVKIVGQNNVEFGIRNGDACGSNGNICADPQLVKQPAQVNRRHQAILDGLSFRPSEHSVTIRRGRSINARLPADFYGNARPATPSVGAVEP